MIRAVAQGIADGVLIADQRLPSIRAMADEHGVSRDTVQRAYDKLVAGGQIYARRGSGLRRRRARAKRNTLGALTRGSQRRGARWRSFSIAKASAWSSGSVPVKLEQPNSIWVPVSST
ncbi:MAG: GntR family transcriptional regulator [Paracoccus sp. (in: a-proteobacteria)]